MYAIRHRLAWMSVYGILAAAFIISILPLLHVDVVHGWDIALLKHINHTRNVTHDAFFRAVTDSAAPVSIFIPVVMLICGYLFKHKTALQAGIYFALSFLVAAAASCLLKHLINKPRPFITYDFIQKVTSGGSPSFPSGHTTDAFVTATAVSLVLRKWYVTLLAYTWALLVAYSRVSLGVHYPTDVLGGMFLGAMVALAGYQWLKLYGQNKTDAW